MKSTLCALLSAVFLWGSAPAPGQESPASPTSLFGEVIDVRVVNLEIVVTEKGERVTGLIPEDFKLTVDGREVPIEYFTEVHGGTAVRRGDESAIGSLPALAPGTPVSTSYLLFIDEYFTIAPRRNKVLRKMIEQLPVMNPEDRMAVVAFDGKKLEMLSSWSQSVESLTRVLEAAIERPAHGLRRLSEVRSFERTRDLFNPDVILDRTSRGSFTLDIEEEQEAQRIANQVKRAVLAASSALRGFANPPGRKVMLMMSGGWPYNPAQWIAGDLQVAAYTSAIDYGDKLFGPLTDTANRLSYTLYPIDVPNTLYDDLTTIDRGSTDAAQLTRNRMYDRQQDERAALNIVAAETGGKPALGAASYSALEQAASDTRSYYWIGFTPTWRGDDESHKVAVKARQRGLKVRSRQGFSDLSRRTEVSMMVESSLLFGGAPSASPLYAEVKAGKKAGRGKVEVPLTVLIPISELTFLPHEGGYVAETELRVAVQDELGNLAEIPIVPLEIVVEKLPREGELRRYETSLKMRKRKHDLIISIYDNASGKILSTRLEAEPVVRAKKN